MGTSLALLALMGPPVLAGPPAAEPRQAGLRVSGEGSPVPPRGALSVDAAVRIALDGHPLQRAAAEGVRAAEAALGETKAAFLPTVELRAGYQRWQAPAFLPDAMQPNGSSGLDTIGPTDDWTAGLAGRYLIADGGGRAARLREALATRALAEHDRRRTREDLALEVKRAFFSAAAAIDGLRVADANLARAREHVQLARARKEAGAAPGGDVIQAEVGAATAQLEQVRMASRVAEARGRLNTAMGLPVSLLVDLQRDVTPPPPPGAPPAEAVLTEAAASRPLSLAALARVTVATAAVEAARSQTRPRIAAEWAAGLRDDDLALSNPDWRVGIAASWTLFDGSASRRRVERARAEEARARAEAARADELVRHEVWTAHTRVVDAFESVGAAAVLVRDAVEGVRVARARYLAGTATVNELLDAETALARAATIEVQAGWDHHIAQAVADWAAGRSAPAVGPGT
jgi:outer membrane protein TolC